MNVTLESRARQWPMAGRRLLASIPLFLMSCWTLAANLEEAASAPELVSGWYVLLFVLLFFGIIAGYFVYLAYGWRRDEETKKQSPSSS